MLRFLTKIAPIALIVLTLALPVFAQETPTSEIALPQGTLTTRELLALFSDKTVYSVTAKGGRESVSYYSPTGELRQKRSGITRSGRWRVTDNNRICLQMENLPDKCRIVVKEQGTYKKYIVRKNGLHQFTVAYPVFQKGNPLGL